MDVRPVGTGFRARQEDGGLESPPHPERDGADSRKGEFTMRMRTHLARMEAAAAAETDGSSGADLIAATPISGIGSANTDTVQEILEALDTLLKAVTDSASGADHIGMTAITETGAAATVQSVIEALITRLKAVTDSASGADLVGMTATAGVTGATVQAQIEWIAARLQAVTDSASGADLVAATAISGWAGATVQAILEAAKTYVDARPKIVVLKSLTAGNITSSITSATLGFGHGAGAITMAGIQLAETGADGTDALTLEMDLKIGGTSVFTTKPKLACTAADGASTFVAGTGITLGVIDTAHDDVVLGSLITCEAAIVRTTPETEMANCTFYVEITYPAP